MEHVKARLHPLVDSRWFQLADLLFVVASGVSWMLIPETAIWFTLIALLIPAVRWLGNGFPFRRTPFDPLIAILLITAWVGYWAAYDRTAAWIKFWLIVSAVLLFYALSAQPARNLGYVSIASYCCAIGISLYFLLTSDFTGDRGGIILAWVKNRPLVHWPAIDPGDIPGLLLLTSTFGLYELSRIGKRSFGSFTISAGLLLALGTAAILVAFQIAMPGGILIIGISVLGVLLLWKFSASPAWTAATRLRTLLPVLVLACLAILIALVYLGPARASDDAASAKYGDDSRAQLLVREAPFLRDYPITGSGLDSFPGLYSQYVLVIPYFYFADSRNLFLDVAIEQGMIGGLAFILIYIGAIWLASSRIANAAVRSSRLFNFLSLLALIVAVAHGWFYDYLYQGKGTFLLLFPAGMAMMGGDNFAGSRDTGNRARNILSSWSAQRTRAASMILIVGLLAILSLRIKQALSIWYADLGAVQMSQAQLKGFPTNHWAGPEMVPALGSAQHSLLSAIAYDPGNETANYRLGLIAMLSEDYPAASTYLESAHVSETDHRGIIKSLGYCYVWQGEFENARELLSAIPEAREELDAYVFWWAAQGRPDLSEKAFLMVSILASSSRQPLIGRLIY